MNSSASWKRNGDPRRIRLCGHLGESIPDSQEEPGGCGDFL
jgi:hypothetical protein